MKRIIIAIVAALAIATPALAQNTKVENDVALAAVMFVTSSKCNLPAAHSARLKAIADEIITRNGWTWDELQTGPKKPIIGYFLIDNPVFERMQLGNKVAIDSMCGVLRVALDSGAL
jgi:hypothetical protein